MNEELKLKLKEEFGLDEEQITKLETEGVKEPSDMALLSAEEIKKATGCGLVVAKKLTEEFAPKIILGNVSEHEAPVESTGDKPSETEIKDFAHQMGMDANTLTLFMLGGMGAGAGVDIDLSTMIPVEQVAGGYSPKIRNMPYLVMGQIARRLGTDIVVINDNGSVNAAETARYVMSLEEGFEPAEDGVYYGEDGTPYDIIAVGVDAQSVYDADPVFPGKALQKSGMGYGRINWNKIPLDVRQMVYLATTTSELKREDAAKLTWLRSTIKPGVTRTQLRTEFPLANTAYNEAARLGTLPTLRVQLSRQPRRPEVMPRRRVRLEEPRDDVNHY